MRTARPSAYLSFIVLLVLGSATARAGECQLAIEADDMMQFNQKKMVVPASCASIELTLKHSGKYPIGVMGHDWVLAKTSDVNALVSAGMTAGLAHNYQPQDDSRIIAATKVVGGGEVASVSFSTVNLVPGGDYTFFCSAPGHWTQMKGRFAFGGTPDDRTARK